MTINKLALTGLASVAIVAATAAPAMACDHNHKPVQKPAVHKTVATHKHTDRKDCDHDKLVVVKKVVEHKTNTPKPNCDHQPVVQPKPVVHQDNHKDCNHKPGKGGVTPTPSPMPQPQKPAVLSATTQPMPATLPQTGSEDLGLLIGLPLAAAGAGIYLRTLRRK